MEGFTAGITLADRCQALHEEIAVLRAELAEYRVSHESDPGAHAAAFAAHGASPGVVEDAEETAQEILDTALETLQEATETAVDLVESTGETAAEAAQGAGEAVGEGTETATEAVAAVPEAAVETASKAVSEESKPERSPRRPHFLHRKVLGRAS